MNQNQIMTDNIANAVLLLQQRSSREFYVSPYYTKIIDRAIDYLLRNPHLDKRPQYLIRNAIANAKKTANNRQRICSIVSLKSFYTEYIPNRHSHNQAIEEFWAFKDWFERIELTDRDKLIINFLLRGKTDCHLAQHWKIPIKQARVRISRTKKRIFRLWQTDSYL